MIGALPSEQLAEAQVHATLALAAGLQEIAAALGMLREGSLICEREPPDTPGQLAHSHDGEGQSRLTGWPPGERAAMLAA